MAHFATSVDWGCVSAPVLWKREIDSIPFPSHVRVVLTVEGEFRIGRLDILKTHSVVQRKNTVICDHNLLIAVEQCKFIESRHDILNLGKFLSETFILYTKYGVVINEKVPKAKISSSPSGLRGRKIDKTLQ
jgi:hypothetical protein